jgi:hypothetical protein
VGKLQRKIWAGTRKVQIKKIKQAEGNLWELRSAVQFVESQSAGKQKLTETPNSSLIRASAIGVAKEGMLSYTHA